MPPAAAAAPAPTTAPSTAEVPPPARHLDARGRLVDPAATDGDRQTAVVLHLLPLSALLLPPLGIIAPLVLWLLVRHRSPFLDDHGRAVIDAAISYTIWFLLAAFTVVGLVLWPVLIVVAGVSIIRGAIDAGAGRYVRHPLSLSLLS